MAVYVDDMRAKFGRMIMCHMWADSLDELLAMVDTIGVARKWLQQPPKASWVHFDIALSKKELAIRHGAVLTDRYGPSLHIATLQGNTAMIARIEALRKPQEINSMEDMLFTTRTDLTGPLDEIRNNFPEDEKP